MEIKILSNKKELLVNELVKANNELKQLERKEIKLNHHIDSLYRIINSVNPIYYEKTRGTYDKIDKLCLELANNEKGIIKIKNKIFIIEKKIGNLSIQILMISKQTEKDILETQKAITLEIEKQSKIVNHNKLSNYHFFISHASEDKKEFVRPLADEMKNRRINVWYDEFELKIGDSLRKSIDYGLKNSQFGIIVLSKSFFDKQWTEYELNGLLNREMNGVKVILPIWHKVSKNEVQEFSPSIADKVALNSINYSIQELVDKLQELVIV